MCSLSATGITLMGTIAGNILRNRKTTDWQKIVYMAATGVGLIILALAFSTFYPIIKKCWTSTFNMLAGGISFLLMALFFLVIDHWEIRRWAFYFRVIGMNSIFVYLFVRIIDMKFIAEFFFGWITKPMNDAGEILILLFGLALILGIALLHVQKEDFPAGLKTSIYICYIQINFEPHTKRYYC